MIRYFIRYYAHRDDVEPTREDIKKWPTSAEKALKAAIWQAAQDQKAKGGIPPREGLAEEVAQSCRLLDFPEYVKRAGWRFWLHANKAGGYVELEFLRIGKREKGLC